MKIVKYLLFLFLILFIAGAIYVATKDGEYSVESTRVIDAPAPLLYKELADLENWKTWSAWSKQKNMNIDLSDETIGEGAELNWQSDEFRDGTVVTTEAIPFKQIEQQIVMQTIVDEAEGKILWKLEPEGDQTRVTWTLEGSQDFKDKLAFTLQENDMADLLHPLFEKSLENLEQNVTRKMAEYSINVDGVTEHGGGYFMYMTSAAKMGEVNEKAADMIEQVKLYMKKNNIPINGKPFVVYNQRDERNGTTIFSAGVPTPSQVITPEGSAVLNGYLEPQKAVKTTLKGNTLNAPEAWEKTYRYIEENGMVVNPAGQPFEIYLTDPSQVENPASWITEIYIPVE